MNHSRMGRAAWWLAAGMLLSMGAQAQQAQRAPSPPQGPGQSMLVLDASGSMWGKMGGGPRSRSHAMLSHKCSMAGPQASNWA